MNFLAHLYVADDSADSRMGSLLGDFVKGTPDPRFSKATRDAIFLHRAIDQFTDTHPVVLASKHLIRPNRRRYAGIIVDICYDHFLCQHWRSFSNGSLSEFIESAYASLLAYEGFLPDRVATITQQLVREDWLHSYQSVMGISATLDRVSKRIRRENPLYGSGEELIQHYDAWNAHFLSFFEDLCQFVETTPAR